MKITERIKRKRTFTDPGAEVPFPEADVWNFTNRKRELHLVLTEIKTKLLECIINSSKVKNKPVKRDAIKMHVEE